MPRAYPSKISIELTNRCNYACRICPVRGSVYPALDMDFAVFKKIIDQIRVWIPAESELTLRLHVFGEPFLYNKIFDALDYIDLKLKRKAWISTNFSSLDPAMIKRLVSPRPYNVELGIWTDALEQQAYAYQRGAGFDRAHANIDYLIKLKNENNSALPEFHVGCIITRKNKRGSGAFLDFWKKKLRGVKGASVRSAVSHDWAGQVTESSVIQKKHGLCVRRRCGMPLEEMVIFSNGDVSPCCFDANHSILIGSIIDQELPLVWSGEKAVSFRQKAFLASLDSFSLCKNCIKYHAPIGIYIKDVFRRILRGSFPASAVKF